MAIWSVKPTWKKSIIERQTWVNGGDSFVYETGWRWGEFTVVTEDDNPPVINEGDDLWSTGYDVEMIETFDGCWEEHHYDDVDDETREWLEEFLEENSYFDLEEHDWIFTDSQFIIECDLEITRINDDGTEGETIITGQDEETQKLRDQLGTPKLTPNDAWPFGNKDE